MGTPLVFGHRGASARALENTLPALAAAVEDGADGVELDVRLSRDGEVVVFHDEDLARLAGRPERVADLDAAALSAVELRGGQRIPTLRQALEVTAPLVVNIEIKPPPRRRLRETVARVRAVVERAAARERVIVSSFDLAVVALIRATTALPTGLLLHAGQVRPLREAWLAPLLRPHAVHPEKVLVTRDSMARWRRRGYQVNTWTADEPDEIRRLAALGVTSIITNDPATARAALAPR
ncbi:MAG TPA: glycerophosphodiester phosphodiesterase [Kofleriaceae bacterium]|nr:glycerophosphodiester phosphodiesterase [Kofleriaceae bacterium]